MGQAALPVNDKREIFGWAMYDWANSAFSTTIGTVFLSPYVTNLAAEAARSSADGMVRFWGIPIDPYSLFPFCAGLSVLAQVLVLPILGAIADYSHLRKRMLQLFATLGALQTILLFLVQGDLWWLGALLFFGANVAFGAAVVFYNAYLPDIASEDHRDRVSSYGWAMGYLGGGILLAANLAFYLFRESLGVPDGLAVRINLASAGLWWLGFSFITWQRLRARHTRRPLPRGENYLSVGFKQLGRTFREVRRYPETIKFLVAYFLYNDGIQTIIIVAANFATAPIARGGLALGQETLTGVILMIQIVAFAGALVWGRLAGRIGPKRAILLSLLVWVGVVVYSYVGLRSQNLALEFSILGAFIALVLGGSQAISRSLFSQLIPDGREAEFYAFYEVSDRGTSSIGPLVFGIVNQALGSYRPAILSLILFFAAGMIALPLVNVRRGIEDVRRAAADSG